MLLQTFLMPGNSVAVCSIMTYTICLLLRISFITISTLTITDNFNVDELNLPNTKELVDELDKSDNESVDDSSFMNNELKSANFYSDENGLIVPRKRTRQPILEVNSYSELLYVIEKYRCVAVLYEDGSPVLYMINITASYSNIIMKKLMVRIIDSNLLEHLFLREVSKLNMIWSSSKPILIFSTLVGGGSI